MTDEEKAEEYCKNSKDFVKYTSETYRKRLKKAYLDGLKAGKPKWHDLRKNPDDLPKERGDYWTKYDDASMEVIAWCEFPKFEE